MLFPGPAMPSARLLTNAVFAQQKEASAFISDISAFPNPFLDKVNFEIVLKQSGKASLELFNMNGQKVKTVFQGQLSAGIQRFSFALPAAQRSMLFYIFRMGSEKRSGKLLPAITR
jgi:hypothetical protein